MKTKIILLLLASIIVLACWMTSFDPNNTLYVSDFKVIKLEQWILTSISVVTCFWSLYFFYKNYEEIFIESTLLRLLLLGETFASCFLASRYLYGGFHESILLWVLSFATAFSAMFIVYKLTIEGDNDKDDSSAPIAGILSDL